MSEPDAFAYGDFAVANGVIKNGSASYAISHVVTVEVTYQEKMLGGSETAGCVIILVVIALTILMLAARAWVCGIVFMVVWVFVTFYRDKGWTLTVTMADGQQIVKHAKVMSGDSQDYTEHPFKQAKAVIERSMAK
jgi:hypothetical protein